MNPTARPHPAAARIGALIDLLDRATERAEALAPDGDLSLLLDRPELVGVAHKALVDLSELDRIGKDR